MILFLFIQYIFLKKNNNNSYSLIYLFILLLFISVLFIFFGYSRTDVFVLLYILLVIIFYSRFNIVFKIINLSFLLIFVFFNYDIIRKTNGFNIIEKNNIPIAYYGPSRNLYKNIISNNFFNYNETNKFELFNNNPNNSFTYRYYKNIIEISNFLSKNISANSLIIAPPENAHKIRLYSKRSIFVDTKVIPFNEKQLELWWKRLNDLLPIKEKNITHSQDELKKYYLKIDDIKLNLLKEKYNVFFAILYKETFSNKKVIYQDENFKLVKI